MRDRVVTITISEKGSADIKHNDFVVLSQTIDKESDKKLVEIFRQQAHETLDKMLTPDKIKDILLKKE